jgi:hypothetical protein
MFVDGWQAHSVRGFLSGELKKKMGLRVQSAKHSDGVRTYRLTRHDRQSPKEPMQEA